MKLSSNKKKLYFFLFPLLIVITLILSNIFLQEIRTFLIKGAENSLKEISQQCSVAIENKLHSRHAIVVSLAGHKKISGASVPLEKKLAMLQNEAGLRNFLRIGISDLDGNAVTTDNEAFNISDRAYFQQAKTGVPMLSGDLPDRVGQYKNTSIVIYAAPIWTNGEVTGVLFATDRTLHLTTLLHDIYSGSAKNAFILTREGKILANMEDKYYEKNLLDIIAKTTTPEKIHHIKQILQSDSSGAESYQTSSAKKLIGIAKIKNTQNWFIAISAPQSTVMLQADSIMNRLIVLIAVIFMFICATFLYFFTLNDKYQQEKENVQLAKLKLQIKDAFLANVSHEIRTPLNAITGMAYLLKSTDLSPLQQNHLQKIETMSGVLLSIVNDILDMSKISSGQLKLHPQPFNLFETLQCIDHIFTNRIREKELDWAVYAENLPELLLLGDKQRLLQILINLINNAYKFTEQGKISLTITLCSRSNESAAFRFSVKDTGIGIAPENIGKIFIPFEQLEDSLNKTYEGTGLGLCICQNLLCNMSSSLEVESSKGEGSTFSFTVSFPIVGKATPTGAPKLYTADDVPTGCAPILLVEDNEINAEIAGALLEELSLPFDWVNNGQDAVEKCRSQTYSAILMDIHMPVLNGYEAAKIIKEQLHAAAPIIALTATSINLDESNSVNKYIDAYITKPFDAVYFKQTLIRYLKQ